MKPSRLEILDPRWLGGSTVLAVALMANGAWGQLIPPVPAVPDVVQDATNTAQDAVKDVTNTAPETVKDVQESARDAQKETTAAAQDAVKTTQDTVKDAQKGTADTVQDAAKSANDTAKDVQKGATKTTQDATNNARDNARDVQRDATKAARDAGRDSRDAVRKTSDDVSDAKRDVTNATRDSLDARGSVRTQGSVSAGRRGDYLGADLGIWFDRSNRSGLTIADVAADAALSAVGFREGDRIVSIAGQNVTTEADFVRFVMNNNARGRTNVIVMRDGQQQTLYLDPNVLNQRMTTSHVEPLEQFGIVLDDRYDDRLIVWRVVPRSPAFYAGIRTGDVITTFANRPVASLRALAQLALQTRAGTIPIQISRNGRTRLIEADFPDVQASSDRHTTFRQNLDADFDVRPNIDTGVRLQEQRATGRANATVRGELDPNLNLPAVETQPPARYDYNNDRPSRRGWRRGR